MYKSFSLVAERRLEPEKKLRDFVNNGDTITAVIAPVRLYKTDSAGKDYTNVTITATSTGQ
jgi:hypothetical protein